MAGAAAAAAAAMHRISEKRSRAHQEEMMTKEEMEERDRQRAIRAAEARAARFVEIKEISAELATPGLSPRCIEMHIILRDNGRFQAFIIGVICIAGILVGVNTYPINCKYSFDNLPCNCSTG